MAPSTPQFPMSESSGATVETIQDAQPLMSPDQIDASPPLSQMELQFQQSGGASASRTRDAQNVLAFTFAGHK